MNTATKLGGYLAALAVVFAAAVGVGSAVGPVGPAADVAPAEQAPAEQTEVGHGGMEMDGDG